VGLPSEVDPVALLEPEDDVPPSKLSSSRGKKAAGGRRVVDAHSMASQ
jgi:hypothetical protein